MAARPAPAVEAVPTPVMRVTSFDRATAGTIAAFIAVACACVSITSAWLTTRTVVRSAAVPVELLDVPGGFEDGSPDETLRVDSPDPEDAMASAVETEAEQLDIAESVETMMELSETASQVVQQQFETSADNTGRRGSAKGTGRRALGFGPGTAGIPREQRWFVRFSDRLSLDEYVQQLMALKIELAALLPDGRVAYLGGLNQPKPMVTYQPAGAADSRLYMTWRAGERQRADLQLFQRAGVELTSSATILHFYPPETEQQLALAERNYRNRQAKEIRRTYFLVQPKGKGYEFAVTRQTTLR
jgi:hypothetical protein